MAYDILEIVLIILAIVVAILIPHLQSFIKRQRAIRAFYEVIWEKSSSLNPETVLGGRPFNEYHEREQDKALNKLLSEKKNTLVIGQPLAGKTRTVYQALINLNKACDVLIPRCLIINIESFLLPRHFDFWKKRLIFIDDLQRFVEMENFDHLFKVAKENNFIIVATCRSGFEFKKVKAKFLDKNIGLETIFNDNIIEMDIISPEMGKEIAEKAKIDWDSVKFNGIIGSIFMKFDEMEKRFQESEKTEKIILRAIKKLHISGVYEERQIFPLKLIKIVSKIDGIDENNPEWIDWLVSLEDKDFIRKKNDTIWSEEAYLENIINLEKSNLDVFDEMITTFLEKPDVLFKIGDKAYETGLYILEKAEYMKIAIKAYQEVLKVITLEKFPVDYAMTQNNIGIAYRTLGEVEDQAENCKRAIKACKEALKIYTLEKFPIQFAITQNNIGNAYVRLGEVEEKVQNCKRAIKAYQEALKVRILEKFPMDYAMTQNNIGNAYRTLGEVEEKVQNCKRAIKACKEALKIYTFEKFPMDYAMAQNNIGIAYQSLGEVEEKAQNCKRAIKACKEALKVRTLEKFPVDYAITQHNIGIAYQSLGEVEDRAENCKRTIKVCKEALKVRTLEKFPVDYAMTQNNIGIAYQSLGEVEDEAENCKRAIKAYQETLKVKTLEKFPVDYAMTQNNIGIAYLSLGAVEDQAENYKRAIKVCKEALKIRTLEKFPVDYAMTQNNLGTAYLRLGQIEDEAENCKRAIKAYQDALKIITMYDFPEIYPIVEKNIRILKENCPDKTLS